MKNARQLLAFAVALSILATLSDAALAQGAEDAAHAAVDLTPLAKGLGAGLAGLAVLGGGPGIGRIGAAACDSVARQPESSNTIFTNMIITAGMVEGATLFAVLIGLLSLFLI